MDGQTVYTKSDTVRVYAFDKDPEQVWIYLIGAYFQASPCGVSVIVSKEQLAEIATASAKANAARAQ